MVSSCPPSQSIITPRSTRRCQHWKTFSSSTTTSWTVSLQLVLCLYLCFWQNTSLSVQAAGVQSQLGGSSFAGGLSYDLQNDVVYVTGLTYSGDGSGRCFVAAVDMHDWNWDRMSTFDSSATAENDNDNDNDNRVVASMCQDITLHGPSTLVLAGNRQRGGLGFDEDASTSATIMSGFAGIIEALQEDPLRVSQTISLTPLKDQEHSSADRIEYPQFLVPATNSQADSSIYSISLTSFDSQVNTEDPDDLLASFAENNNQNRNWLETLPYGSSYDMTVRKYLLQQDEFLGVPEGPVRLETVWQQEFPLQERPGPRVHIGGVILKQNRFLAVVGSTRGQGLGYGPSQGDDQDGFITLLDLQTGEILHEPNEQGQAFVNNIRIGTEQDDVLMGVCDHPQDPLTFFVVGATFGTFADPIYQQVAAPEGSLTAFVAKIDTRSLRPQWIRQFGARMSAGDINTLTGSFASGCAVIDQTVYVAGGVRQGAGMMSRLMQDIDDKTSHTFLESKGGEDIWIASLSTHAGDTNWMHQVGSEGQERLSRHGGVATNVAGNVILYGDTTGSLYRDKDNDSSDVFLMVLDAASGDYAEHGSPVAAPVRPSSTENENNNGSVLVPVQEEEQNVPFVAVGDQLAGNIRAGGMAYDARNQQAWLTGGSYTSDVESQCFLTRADLKTGRIHDPAYNYGKENDSKETCSAVAYSQQRNLVYPIGDTPQDGFLVGSNLYASPKEKAKTFGLLLQIDPDDASNVMGAAFEHHEYVNEPIQIVLDPSEEYAYVIHMSGQNREDYEIPEVDREKFIVAGSFAYGRNFKVRVVKYRLKVDRNSPEIYRAYRQEWTAQFWVDEEDHGAYPTGLVLAGNSVVVVGSTRGTAAEGIINGEYVPSPYGTENPNYDMDGFLIKLDAETGDFQPISSGRSATRLDSINSKDDWVLGACVDAFDQESVYVVGASQGRVSQLRDDEQPPEGTTHAFVTKINLNTLKSQWLRHFTMAPNQNGDLATGAAYGCAVTKDNLVYIAGFVDDGARMTGASMNEEAAKDDIFVAQLNGVDGAVNWIQQIGTREDERLAHNNGIAVDDNGNAIVYGSTAGSFYRERSADATSMEAVIFTMSKKDGSYKQLVEWGGTPLPPLGEDEVDSEVRLPDTISALQTGPDVGPTYAGGMFYDRRTNTIHVTGETYGTFSGPGVEPMQYSDCFYGSATLPRFQLRERRTYGSKNAPEACNSISMTTVDNLPASVVVGTTASEGILTSLGTGNRAVQYGFALDLASVDGAMELQGGALMDANAVQYPIMVETADDEAWVASMVSSDSKVTPDFAKTSDKEFPNLTSGGIEKYGSKFQIVIEKYQIQRTGVAASSGLLENSLQRVWRKPFKNSDAESVHLSDMISVSNGSVLVVVGFALGRKRTGDIDGIMAKVDPSSGDLVTGGGRRNKSEAYLESAERRDDWILGACEDPEEPNNFYIVGSTQGTIERNTDRGRRDVTVHALVAKISLGDLDTIWTQQFEVNHASGTNKKAAAAVAFGCDIIRGSGEMYVAGTVENGAVLKGTGVSKSAGRDDIFVAKLLTRDGNVRWVKQVGSNGDDRVARHGGVKVDANGNAVVFGDTNGSFFRERSADGASQHFSDLFMMAFNRADGAHVKPVVAGPSSRLPHHTGTPREWFPNGVTRGNPRLRMILIILFSVLLALCLGGYCKIKRRHQKEKAETHKASVFAYLQRFNVEDLDLRKSPAGGWHGTYLKKLAYGVNTNKNALQLNKDFDEEEYFLGDESDPEEGSHSSFSHSSVVTDSLFMDTTSKPNLGTLDDIYGLYGEGPESADDVHDGNDRMDDLKRTIV